MHSEFYQVSAEAAEKIGLLVRHGVYIGVGGPQYETPAEIRAFRTLGADVVGMSTVYEVIAANHCGLPVLGMSGIFSAEDALEFLCAGATAVAVGTANFVDPETPLRVLDGIRDYMVRHGFRRVSDIALPL